MIKNLFRRKTADIVSFDKFWENNKKLWHDIYKKPDELETQLINFLNEKYPNNDSADKMLLSQTIGQEVNFIYEAIFSIYTWIAYVFSINEESYKEISNLKEYKNIISYNPTNNKLNDLYYLYQMSKKVFSVLCEKFNNELNSDSSFVFSKKLLDLEERKVDYIHKRNSEFNKITVEDKNYIVVDVCSANLLEIKEYFSSLNSTFDKMKIRDFDHKVRRVGFYWLNMSLDNSWIERMYAFTFNMNAWG